jgi:hypothetical protein
MNVTCSLIDSLGFTFNSCIFSWNWTINEPSSIVCHLMICVIYYVSVVVLQSFVHNTKFSPPKWIDYFKYVHNLSLSAVSLWMAIVMIQQMHQSHRFDSFHSMACVNSENTGMYGKANFVYLVSKIWVEF